VRICIRDQAWDRLEAVQFTESDRSKQTVVTATVELHTGYEQGAKQLAAIDATTVQEKGACRYPERRYELLQSASHPTWWARQRMSGAPSPTKRDRPAYDTR